MRIFGELLPFIGWRRLTRSEAVERGIDTPVGYGWSVFELEWFFGGLTVFGRLLPMGVK